ncbi:thioredoxin domain-containing protein [candidate division KSB1 bacterium]
MSSSDSIRFNHLKNETSPYLLQHANNPVDWYPWGEEAFNKAKNEKKMLIISIGYSSCHWCHVMEKESFMDEEIADIMNSRFVSIKVDREERPDIDMVYMNAVQMIHGQGGWPLNCIALPDGKPVWGGTYFNKTKWKETLEQLASLYSNKLRDLQNQAENISNGLLQLLKNLDTEINKSNLEKIFNKTSSFFDNKNGGTIGAPKFPMPSLYLFLLRYYHVTKNKDLLDHINITLKSMAFGGIYDQIGGGFARYSTDIYWKVPHFEKMLYDNAQLVSLYSEAYQLTKNELYKNIVFETLGFIESKLTSKEGAFYASLDADSEGVEGKYYVWEKEEVTEILKDDAPVFIDYYGIEKAGKWEYGNILLREHDEESYAIKHGLDVGKFKKLLIKGRKLLLRERDKRIKPDLDNKILTSWNALMIKAYTDAYTVFNDTDMLEKAIVNANFILNKMSTIKGGLCHTFNKNKQIIEGLLEDYCFFIDALIHLYQITFDSNWLKHADRLMKYVIAHFYDNNSGMFYINTGNDQNLIKRPKELIDNVIPASNSSMARSLLKLGLYYDYPKYKEMAKRMLGNLHESLIKYPTSFSNWAILLLEVVYTQYIVTILGNEAHEKRIAFNQYYEPLKLFAGGIEENFLPHTQQRLVKGETMIYVCTEKDCRKPTIDIQEAINQLKVI